MKILSIIKISILAEIIFFNAIMTDERWQNLRGIILDNFEVESEDKQMIKDIPMAHIQSIIFKGYLGRMKVERTVKPIVLDKKTAYSSRSGVAKKTEYIYSKDEFSYKLRAYKWDEDNHNWVEIEVNTFT